MVNGLKASSCHPLKEANSPLINKRHAKKRIKRILTGLKEANSPLINKRHACYGSLS